MNADGSFTYTPTAAARLAASKAGGASAATKTETVTFTIGDGFGGTTTTSVNVSIAPPNPTTNNAPTNGQATVDDTSSAIGTVTGTVTADDPDGDTLTYSLGSGPAFGAATVTSDGKFTYIPDVDARYRALVTPGGDDTDTFTVTVTDAFGATTTATVGGVTIAPPSATAVDQRPTEIAVNAQQMYFYSQTDTDKAMGGLLKDAGITTIRIMLPWAGIEPADVHTTGPPWTASSTAPRQRHHRARCAGYDSGLGRGARSSAVPRPSGRPRRVRRVRHRGGDPLSGPGLRLRGLE